MFSKFSYIFFYYGIALSHKFHWLFIRDVLLLSNIIEKNLSEAMFQQLYSPIAKFSEMRLVPDNLHRIVLSYKDRLPENNFCESKKSNML